MTKQRIELNAPDYLKMLQGDSRHRKYDKKLVKHLLYVQTKRVCHLDPEAKQDIRQSFRPLFLPAVLLFRISPSALRGLAFAHRWANTHQFVFQTQS